MTEARQIEANNKKDKGSNLDGLNAELPNVPLTHDERNVWKRLLSFHKEAMEIVGSTADVFLKVLPIFLVVPGFMVWIYLKRLNHGDLFVGSIASSAGILLLLVASVLLVLAIFCQFFLPSMFLSYLAVMFDDEVKREDLGCPIWVAASLPTIIWLGCFGYAVMAVTAPMAVKDSPGLAASLAAFLSAVCLIWLMNRRLSTPTCRRRKIICFISGAVLAVGLYFLAFKLSFGIVLSTLIALSCSLLLVACGMSGQWVRVAMQILLTAITATTSCAPLLVGTWIVERQAVFLALPIAAYCVVAVISLFALLPGVIALDMYLRDRSVMRASMGALFVAAGLTYVFAAAILNFVPVSGLILKRAGVYNNDIETFQLLKPELAYSARAVGLPVKLVKGTGVKDVPGVFFSAGFVRYSFGPVKLICARPFEPDSIHRSRSGTATEKSLTEAAYREAGKGCLPLKSDDIQVVTR